MEIPCWQKSDAALIIINESVPWICFSVGFAIVFHYEMQLKLNLLHFADLYDVFLYRFQHFLASHAVDR